MLRNMKGIIQFDILKKSPPLQQKAFFALLLFAVSSVLSAQDSGLPADLSATALLEAVAGRRLDWRPDWPLSAPPDLFYTIPESAVITVSVEEPEQNFAEQADVPETEEAAAEGLASEEPAAEEPAADKNTAGENAAEGIALMTGEISVEWRNGRLTRFPVLRDSSFIQARAEYNAAGNLSAISGEDFELAILEYDGEGRPVSVRLRTDGGYFFAAIEYAPNRVTETWYDENGSPQSVLYTDKTGDSAVIHYGENGGEAETSKFFFNSHGLVSEIRSPRGTWSAQYERRGLPARLERNLENGTERYGFQWDETGRLTSLFARVPDAGSPAQESRFEYVLDDRGNWITRREIRMINLSGRLFPAPGALIKRRIHYGSKP
jgi:hypothetical protein